MANKDCDLGVVVVEVIGMREARDRESRVTERREKFLSLCVNERDKGGWIDTHKSGREGNFFLFFSRDVGVRQCGDGLVRWEGVCLVQRGWMERERDCFFRWVVKAGQGKDGQKDNWILCSEQQQQQQQHGGLIKSTHHKHVLIVIIALSHKHKRPHSLCASSPIRRIPHIPKSQSFAKDSLILPHHSFIRRRRRHHHHQQIHHEQQQQQHPLITFGLSLHTHYRSSPLNHLPPSLAISIPAASP